MNDTEKKQVLLNLLSLLSQDGERKVTERPSLLSSARAFRYSRDAMSELMTEWKEKRKPHYFLNNKEADLQILAGVIAAFSAEREINDTEQQALVEFGTAASVDQKTTERVLESLPAIGRIQSFDERVRRTVSIVSAPGASFSHHGGASGSMSDFYIASQVTREGLDELQRLLLAASLGIHVAIDGPPGVGKTRAVSEVSRLLGVPLYTKTCSSRTTESHIISHPVLASESGASVTRHVHGPLARAMEEGAIFYGDEFNLLKEDVQKRLNSAFDERRYIDRNDGVQVTAATGFWGVISYNPTEGMMARDLEDSVADRFAHFHFARWTPDFKAFVSAQRATGGDPLKKSGTGSFKVELGWRGIDSGRFLEGQMVEKKLVWSDFFTGENFSGTPAYRYRVYAANSVLEGRTEKGKKVLDNLEKKAFRETDLARMISRYTDLLHALARDGKSPLLDRLGMSRLVEDEDLELLSMHESSTRIEIVALRLYHDLVARGWNRYLAQASAVRLVVDQVCFGQYRTRKLRDISVYQLAWQVARGMHLVADSSNFNTQFDLESFLDNK